jgi:L-asparaginase
MDEINTTIQCILTGGTIDSIWNPMKDTATPAEHSSLPEYFKQLKLYTDVIFSEVCMKDSRTLTPEDMISICNAIEESPYSKILVTHGTYTMPDTARFIKSRVKRTDQTIILTGSMTPLKGFEFTDAPFNLGFAVGQVLSLPAGVYLCMNGKNIHPGRAAKNISEGRIYSIFSKNNNAYPKTAVKLSAQALILSMLPV